MQQNKTIFFTQIICLAVLLALMIFRKYTLQWDLLGIVFFIAVIWHKQGLQFIKNFAPFFLLIYTYAFFAQPNNQLSHQQIHITDLISWEQKLFGVPLPGAVLQHRLALNSHYQQIILIISNVLYMTHFFLPYLMALVIWTFRKIFYWQFMIGFIILNYSGFITWTLFPAAPPWWATYFQYLTGDSATFNISSLPTEKMLTIPNPVAAMPSLHAAYPLYLSLFALTVWGKKALPFLALPLGVGFAAVYLGHHYVIDVLAGYLYAIVAFLIIKVMAKYFFVRAESRTRTVS